MADEKGKKGGECKRWACDNGPAHWFNPNTHAYYCGACARRINDFIDDPKLQCRIVGLPANEGPAAALCGDRPPPGYPTDKTRCTPCPRRAAGNEEVVRK